MKFSKKDQMDTILYDPSGVQFGGQFETLYPDTSECLNLHEYTTRTKKKSKFIKGVEVDGATRINCPRCGKMLGVVPQHALAFRCGGCNLSMQTFGNALNIWEE